ncbi:MAG: histidine phosphatase family protein [Planctomycetes bacterium]|nr:histidine phosphatase family protein [Planctomycetota bacterium]
MKSASLPLASVALRSALLLLVLAPGSVRFGRQEAALPPAAQRTVILVRHAEKSSDDPRDPSLSERGRERAQALAELLARAGVKRLVASEYRRTQETLAPLAAALGIAIESTPAREFEALATSLSETPAGATVVVAGHSNTVPLLAARLGAALGDVLDGPQGPALDEQEYDRMFVLTLPPAGSALAPSVLELAYGHASP